DLHRGAKELVAAVVVAVRVRVDDRRHRLAGNRLDLVENGLAPIRELGIDQDDACVGDERRGVAAAAGDHVEVLFDLFDFSDIRTLRAATTPFAAALTAGRSLESRKRYRQRADRDQRDKCETSFHESLLRNLKHIVNYRITRRDISSS